ncbi:hypothetical protein CAEBREN_07608 [Caenorhabditis brenneri]|uniref:HotDog ACOT-type domain-containing protein n=1 Tax=Caenorhabditis brenneri TaxID=135651 RepID=G0M6I0_CAEBE|nr:hypothetical protein CAEBREN_07608 [Caenorhabditis brenneri]
MSVNASARALQSKGSLINKIKNYNPKFPVQRARHPEIRTMDQLYDCFYKYARQLIGAEANPNITLESRKMIESELKVVIPLATDFKARLNMTDSNGHIRMGRLLEAIDIVAPCACYMLNREDLSLKTFETGTMPRMFVTARFHQTSLSHGYGLSPYSDIVLRGKVTWTSDNKAEATVNVIQNKSEFLTAQLVFTSLDGTNTARKLPTNQLLPATPIEKFLNQQRHKANTSRPAIPELGAIQLPVVQNGQQAMSSTTVETTTIAQPEHENPYGSVFGGFLVRKGLETAELCAKMFAKTPLRVASIDDAEFLKVVEIGSILKFSSFICNVNNKEQKFQISSQVEVFNTETSTFELCDRFLFTFETEEEINLPQVVPHNMQEFVAQWKAKNIAKAN